MPDSNTRWWERPAIFGPTFISYLVAISWIVVKIGESH